MVMSRMPAPSSVYVTGTDTGVGKTVASCALLHALRARGLRATGMKPVASGCARGDDGWRSEDALALIDASAVRAAYALHNPFALPAPTAPQLAARDAGIAVTLAPIQAAYAALQAHGEAVVVEGVGGWAAPLAHGFEQADLVRALDVPVVMVVGLRLGCLSHARLTARAIAADGCVLAGWIGSTVDRDFERLQDYLQLLREALPAPCVGVLPHGDDAAALSEHLALRHL
jgi:dethiobiotin synthetase